LKQESCQQRGRDPAFDPSLKDQLEYMSDLLLELKAMADAHDLSTLAGILNLAYAEARLRSKETG
jgi:hypothetical protein